MTSYPDNKRVTIRLTPEQYVSYKNNPKKHIQKFRDSLNTSETRHKNVNGGCHE